MNRCSTNFIQVQKMSHKKTKLSFTVKNGNTTLKKNTDKGLRRIGKATYSRLTIALYYIHTHTINIRVYFVYKVYSWMELHCTTALIETANIVMFDKQKSAGNIIIPSARPSST